MSSGKNLLTKTEMALQYFLKLSIVKFYGSTFCGFEILNPYIRTDGRDFLNPLKPNDLKKRRTAQLTFRCCILYIYSTKIRTEYFKHAA